MFWIWMNIYVFPNTQPQDTPPPLTSNEASSLSRTSAPLKGKCITNMQILYALIGVPPKLWWPTRVLGPQSFKCVRKPPKKKNLYEISLIGIGAYIQILSLMSIFNKQLIWLGCVIYYVFNWNYWFDHRCCSPIFIKHSVVNE